MTIIVYWMEPHYGSNHREFEMGKMSEALTFCNDQRNAGLQHVSMSVENPNSIGVKGVNEVKDGKTPDGHEYTWTKQDRAGKSRR